MLSPTYEITTALSHTDELISPPYDIAIVTISYGRVTMSSVWDSMMSKKNMGWPFYAAVLHTLNISCSFGQSVHSIESRYVIIFKSVLMLKWLTLLIRISQHLGNWTPGKNCNGGVSIYWRTKSVSCALVYVSCYIKFCITQWMSCYFLGYWR